MSDNPTSPDFSAKFASGDAPLPPRFSSRPHQPPVEGDLVDQTKFQIRSLVQEIADLAKTNCTTEAFYEGFLLRTTSALASVGGAIWTRPSIDQPLALQYHINLTQTPLATDPSAQLQHSRLLEKLSVAAEPTLVPPNSGTGETDSGNPTNYLLMFGPLVVDQQLVGLVEIIQRPGGGPATQRGYLRFLTQMCEIAGDFLKSNRLRSFVEQQQLWQELEVFSREVHRGLDLNQIAFTVANEGRRIIGCDRVSVAVRTAGRMRVAAVSGLDTIERRADQVKRLGELADSVMKTGRELWYQGNDAELAPQIERPLHAYIDKSHAKMLAVIPLTEPIVETQNEQNNRKKRPAIIAALIVEQLTDTQLSLSSKKRTEIVSDHARSALSNAHEHRSIPFAPLLGKLKWITAPLEQSRLPKTLVVLSVVAACVLALCVVPYPFTLGAKGKMLAESQQVVFAHVNGTLVSIFESDDPDANVEEGAVLAEMVNPDLMLQIKSLEGQLNQNQAQVIKLNRSVFERNLERRDKILIEGELAKANSAVDSLTQEIALARQQADQLIVRSPISGHVVDWQLRRNLLGRPVNRGESLMTVVAPDTRWQVELQVPERRVGHLLNVATSADEPITVSFSLASNPGKQFTGKIASIDRVLDVLDSDGNSNRVLVEFDNSQTPMELLRAGTRVTAKIHCGNRSVGYVLFHEFFETIHATYHFWF